MSDNWSLKGKRKYISSVWGGGSFEGFELLDDEDGEVIEYKNIETLRKKLIKDLEKEYESWFSRDYIILGNIIKNIVNKRFGVKDNAKSKK